MAVAMEVGGAQEVGCWYQVLPWATASPWMRSDRSGVAIPSVRISQSEYRYKGYFSYSIVTKAKGGVLLTYVTSNTAVSIS